ncbi:conserved hypothetical protein [Histoplasma capsulatum G186AR]|uniref:Aminoglycoside phosphotransferase domain-containing protein n=1 Tax=Ajellomyces capsulatus (strain G186AR / H82 / ATCC MYA-2454 / RMSCC 2432) TaxID=447093 RepID=C0NW11_AJECG|nr:uncharacterized protein HCBG_07341 [Histoplasma capsulatum G186AR]EEH04116.1 conserved hypothetical protein [Histoplasma capsulatum G186AR]
MAALPWNIPGSASQLFFQDKQSAQYKALLAITDVPHPDRSILGAFINDAFDPQEAARYFLRMTCAGERSQPKKNVSQFLSDWKIIIDKFRPTRATSLSSEIRMLIYDRDGGCCCLSRTPFKSYSDPDEEFVHMVSPLAFSDQDLSEGYFVGSNTFTRGPNVLRSLSTDTMVLENRTPQLTPILDEELFGFHARFSKVLAWMDAKEHMNTSPGAIGAKKSCTSVLVTPFLRIFRPMWIMLPSFIRAFVYDKLHWVGFRMYGRSLSMTVQKLPFGLYLRRGSPVLTPKYHVEAHTLRLVEQFTRIPAPRPVDVLGTPRFSYLLMTCVPGRPIGPMIDTMTDEELKQVVLDLKEYVSQLRNIPRPTTDFQICNSEGGGLLDWRIPDSQREELRFKTEADFNNYLTDPFCEEIRQRAARSHDICHEIVFTHGDLNPRNILAENGKITGIVDWENAGWFPEYWEFTKAHYTVRSLIRWLADVIDRVFERYRDELLVENMLSDLLGPF